VKLLINVALGEDNMDAAKWTVVAIIATVFVLGFAGCLTGL
jgi:hypothetical protein